MSLSLSDYHLNRARMERLAAERAVEDYARKAHLVLAELHTEKALEARTGASANDAIELGMVGA